MFRIDCVIDAVGNSLMPLCMTPSNNSVSATSIRGHPTTNSTTLLAHLLGASRSPAPYRCSGALGSHR